MGFAENLKAQRKKQNLTQQQLAETVGVSTVMINRYEMGVKIPNIIYGVKIAEALRLTVEELVNGEFVKQKDEEGT